MSEPAASRGAEGGTPWWPDAGEGMAGADLGGPEWSCAPSSEPRSLRLAADVEHHLLLTQLAADQARSCYVRGWFDLPWPEQRLVLRIHTERVPTVDGYQARRIPAMDDSLGSRCAAGSQGHRWVAGTYLTSWDVRFVQRSCDGRITFVTAAATLAGQARRVLEAHRRGVLRAFLEAARSYRVPDADRLAAGDPSIGYTDDRG